MLGRISNCTPQAAGLRAGPGAHNEPICEETIPAGPAAARCPSGGMVCFGKAALPRRRRCHIDPQGVTRRDTGCTATAGVTQTSAEAHAR